MNKKAQALALFITLIPVIFVVVMFVYESSVFVNKKVILKVFLKVR